MTPLFSIIIPTFNVKDKLALTLESLRAQNFSDLEIVVQDGNSTDGTKEYLQSQRDIHWKSEADSGIYNAMNRAIATSTGQFLLFLGAGDTLRPSVLPQIAAHIEAQKARDVGEALLIYGDVFWQSRNLVHGGRFSQWRFTRTNVCHQAIFYERSIFQILGLYDERYIYSADYALNISAWGNPHIRKVHVPIVVSDFEGGGVSDTGVDELFVSEVLGLIRVNFSFPVRTLYLLRRRSPSALKRLLMRQRPASDGEMPPESEESRVNRDATVSVVVPTFNRGARVQSTLDSVLAQTHPPLEIIVVDDGSSDGTPDWIKQHYGDAVRVERQKNGGVARARNKGLRLARGEWIAFLDHDDLWHPAKLETMLAHATSEIGVVVCGWREVGSEGEPMGKSPQNPGQPFGWLFGWHNPIVSMSVPLIRRKALLEIGGFDPQTVPADDWDAWLRLAQKRQFAFVPDVLVDYTLHEGQQRRDGRKMFRAARRVLSKQPFQLARRPLLLWWLLWSGAFVPSLEIYEQAKATKLGGEWVKLAGQAVRAHPLALLSPQWMVLLARKLTRRS